VLISCSGYVQGAHCTASIAVRGGAHGGHRETHRFGDSTSDRARACGGKHTVVPGLSSARTPHMVRSCSRRAVHGMLWPATARRRRDNTAPMRRLSEDSETSERPIPPSDVQTNYGTSRTTCTGLAVESEGPCPEDTLGLVRHS
jgi:hypothetical protein